jgi:diguanylate cyclase (GGDEF)-like protein
VDLDRKMSAVKPRPHLISALMSDPTLIHQVAETTSQRDRDALDQSVVQLLFQFLDARSIALYRIVHDGAIERVSRSLVMQREQVAPDPAPTEVTCELPVLSEMPTWQQCVSAGQELTQLTLPNGLHRALFAVNGSREVAGLFEIDTDKQMEPRDSELVRGILKILTNQLSLLDYGERDELTGLLNRKTFENRFDKRFHRRGEPQRRALATRNTPEKCWLGLLDVDRFKSINDTYGHLFGDEVLLLVSQIMVRTAGRRDRVFRFGGEEFVIMLEEDSQEAAHAAFERVRAAIDAHEFPQIGHVTVSMGYTQILPHDVPATCMERADAALYFAKRNGRNNTRQYEALIASGDLVGKSNNDDFELF